MSVEFEPIRLGPRRRRDPVLVGAVVVSIALLIAVAKPWAQSSEPANGADVALASTNPLPSAEADASPTVAPTVAIPRVIQARPVSSVRSDIVAAIRRHETWGIRAVVSAPASDGPSTRRVERWFALPDPEAESATARVDVGDVAILALGITFPPSRAPLDVRIWKETDRGLEWMDIEQLDQVPSNGAFLYVQPGGFGGSLRSWSGGTYRMDLLVDGSVERVAITIPDRFSNVPGPEQRPSLRDLAPLTPPQALLTELPMGLFATVDGTAVPLLSEEGPALGEAAAWLDLDPGTRREPRTFVDAVFLPRATGLGVALPEHSVVVAASVERLAPEPLPGRPERVDTGRGGAATSMVLFRAIDGGAWMPGVYRITVRWTDGEGPHESSWHAELRPGIVRTLPPLLAAARAWIRYAGSTGVILGSAEPLEGGPRAARIRLLTLGPGDAAYPVTNNVGCGGTTVAGSPELMGFAYPADRAAGPVTARVVLPFLRRDDTVVLTASTGIPGLIIVAPARIQRLPEATYRFSIGSGPNATVFALCFGMTLFDG